MLPWKRPIHPFPLLPVQGWGGLLGSISCQWAKGKGRPWTGHQSITGLQRQTITQMHSNIYIYSHHLTITETRGGHAFILLPIYQQTWAINIILSGKSVKSQNPQSLYVDTAPGLMDYVRQQHLLLNLCRWGIKFYLLLSSCLGEPMFELTTLR